jgi:hypothetical protein
VYFYRCFFVSIYDNYTIRDVDVLEIIPKDTLRECCNCRAGTVEERDLPARITEYNVVCQKHSIAAGRYRIRHRSRPTEVGCKDTWQNLWVKEIWVK